MNTIPDRYPGRSDGGDPHLAGPARPITRRQYLTLQAILDGTPMLLATEAVATTAIAHPEWDMDEVKTFSQWAASKSPDSR